MSKAADFWGPATWRTLHSIAVAYDPTTQKAAAKSFVKNLMILLPCDKCRDHWKDVLKQYPIENYLDDNHSFFLWTYLVHDAVNKDNGKTSPPYEDVKVYCFNALGEKCSSCEKS